METEEFLELVGKAWAFLKRVGKHIIEVSFTSWEDIFYTAALFGGFIAILIFFSLSARNMGYDRGETQGLRDGWANGTTYQDSAAYNRGWVKGFASGTASVDSKTDTK